MSLSLRHGNLWIRLLLGFLLDLLHSVVLLEICRLILAEIVLHLLLLRHEVVLRHSHWLLIHSELWHIHLLVLIRLLGIMMAHHLCTVRCVVHLLVHSKLVLNLVVHHHLGMWVNVALLELGVLLLKLSLDASLHVWVIEVFVSLLDCKHNLTALITKLHPL